MGAGPLGGYFTVALDSNGLDFGWGNNSVDGEIGGLTASVSTQAFKGGWSASFGVQAQPFSPQRIAAGAYHTCISSPTDGVFCRGNYNNGQSGPGQPFQQQIPLPPGTVFEVGAGGYHTCAVIGGTKVACWGEDSDGQVTGNAGAWKVDNPVVLAVP
jgi:hypothetical protein